MPDSVADGVPAPAQAAPLRALVDAAPFAMAIVDEQGLFELVNAAYATLYSYIPIELLGQHCTLVLPPSERTVAAASFAATWTDPHTQQEEHLVETPQGAPRVVRVTSMRMTEADGRSYRAVYAEDLTELRHAEGAEAVAQERELVRVLMDIMPDTIYVKDTASRFTRINAAQAAFLGVDRPEDALGKTDGDFFPSDLAEQLYREEQQIITSGEPWVNALERHTDTQGQPR
jgi:PAS domain S-box-containing protein